MAYPEDIMHKKNLLNALLQDGCKYLRFADELLQRNSNDFPNYQKLLEVMDSFSRHLMGLKEDIDIVREAEDKLDMAEALEDEEPLTLEELELFEEDILFEESCSNWIHEFSLSIIQRRNVLMSMEIELMKKLDSYAKQMNMWKEFSRIFQNYRATAVASIKQINKIEMDPQLSSQFIEKCGKLNRIVDHINEVLSSYYIVE